MSVDTSSILFFAIFALVAGSFIFRILKYGGFKAGMFGAPIERTIGEAAVSGGKILKTVIRVHVLGGAPDKAVGLEFVAKSFASYQMLPVALSESEVRNLIRFLETAVVEAGDRGP